MVYETKKKNKVLILLCAAILAFASLFGLVQVVGTTYASYPNKQAVTAEWFNYKSADYSIRFDGYYNNYYGYAFLTSNLCRFVFLGDNTLFSDYSEGVNNYYKFYFYYNNNIYDIVFQDNISFSATTNEDGINYFEMQLSYSNTSLSFSTFNLYSDNFIIEYLHTDNNYYYFGSKSFYDYNQLYLECIEQGQNYKDGYNAGIEQGQNNILNNPNDFNLYTDQQVQDSYNQGYIDGEQSTNAYQDGLSEGITQGQNNVLIKPGAFDLYTETQYEKNYEDGYVEGLKTAKLGIFANANSILSVRSKTSIDGVPTFSKIFENPFVDYYNGLIINPNLIATNSEFYNLSNDYIYTINITLQNPIIYNHDKLSFGFVNNEYVHYPTIINYYLTDKDNNVYDGTYIVTPVYENENQEDLLTYKISDNYPLNADGKEITTIGFVVSGEFLKYNGVYIFQNGFEFQNGYQLGFTDGTTSEIVNNAYNEGYTEGNRVGYQQGLSNGLANSNDYTFFGLIGAVIDAPIQYISSLLNFNVLGFNMLTFFTSLLTVCLIVWLIKFALGGK